MSITLPWMIKKQVPIRRSSDDFDSVNRLTPALEIEHLFENFLSSIPSFSTALSSMETDFWPSMDVHESEQMIEISAELPGMDEKDVKVTMSNDLLTISGEKRYEKDETKNDCRRFERRYGSFSRSIRLPTYTEFDKAEAEFKNGVLTVKLPKSAEFQKSVRSIPIKSANGGNGSNN